MQRFVQRGRSSSLSHGRSSLAVPRNLRCPAIPPYDIVLPACLIATRRSARRWIQDCGDPGKGKGCARLRSRNHVPWGSNAPGLWRCRNERVANGGGHTGKSGKGKWERGNALTTLSAPFPVSHFPFPFPAFPLSLRNPRSRRALLSFDQGRSSAPDALSAKRPLFSASRPEWRLLAWQRNPTTISRSERRSSSARQRPTPSARKNGVGAKTPLMIGGIRRRPDRAERLLRNDRLGRASR